MKEEGEVEESCEQRREIPSQAELVQKSQSRLVVAPGARGSSTGGRRYADVIGTRLPTPEQRAARVAHLRQQIASNTYQVDTRALAAKMLDRSL